MSRPSVRASDADGATEITGQENAGLDIDGQKIQGVENDGHSIKGRLMPVHVHHGACTFTCNSTKNSKLLGLIAR